MSFNLGPFALSCDGELLVERGPSSPNSLLVAQRVGTGEGGAALTGARAGEGGWAASGASAGLAGGRAGAEGQGAPEGGRLLRLSLAGVSRPPERVFAFIACDGAADGLLSLGGAVRLLQVGVLGTMALYGATLYAFKRTEPYLLRFAVYAALLSVWALLIYNQSALFPLSSALFSSVRTLLVTVTLLLATGIAYNLLGLLPPRWLTSLLLPRRAAVLGLALGLVSLLTGGAYDAWVQLPAVLAAVAGAAAAVLDRRAADVALLATFALTALLRANGSLLSFMLLPQSFVYSFILTAPVFDIPFAVAAMLETNRRFARKYAEAEELGASLDAQVKERTQRLSEVLDQKRAFTLNVFHDLRSPLFVASRCLDLACERPERAQECLPVARERVRFMRGLTDDLFLMAKLEDDKVIFSFDHVDLARLLGDCARACRVRAEAKGSGVELDCAECPPVEGDEGYLKRAFENILANAVDATEPGTPVEVGLRRSGGSAVVTVRDHGPGVPPEERESIFKRYYASAKAYGSPAGAPPTGSTGLGLSIAAEVVARHGGAIEAGEAPGGGALFTVSLPLADGGAA